MSYYKQDEFEEYFWNKAEQQGDCLIWTAAKRNGYGRVILNGKGYYTHRLAYELHNKVKLSRSQIIRHWKCNNKLCIKPNHLKLGTQKQNIEDKKKFGTQSYGETHPVAKTKEFQILNARKRYWIDGESHQALADELGLTSGGMLNALNGRSWRHLENYIRPRKKNLTACGRKISVAKV